ncbi:unnamed protein product, partial [Mesorhabditis spiculigera]
MTPSARPIHILGRAPVKHSDHHGRDRSDSCQGCRHGHLPHLAGCALEALCESLPTSIPVFEDVVQKVRKTSMQSCGLGRSSSFAASRSHVKDSEPSTTRTGSHHHLEIWAGEGTNHEIPHKHHHSGPIQKTVSYIRNKFDSGMAANQAIPTLEELREWETNFEALITSKFGVTLFREYLKKELSSENIDFWCECEEYKKMKHGKKDTTKKCTEIFNTFLRNLACREVNLDSSTKQATKAAFENGCPLDTFDLAQSRIYQLMEKDSYRRFLKDVMFTELVELAKAKAAEAATTASADSAEK